MQQVQQARQVVGQLFCILCTVSSLLLFYTALMSGNSALGLLGCLDGAGAYLFFRRSQKIGKSVAAESANGSVSTSDTQS